MEHKCKELQDSGYTSIEIEYYVYKSSLTGKTRRGWSLVVSGDEETTWTDINYCPFCGEKLGKEAAE